MSELTSQQVNGLNRIVFRIRITIGVVAACTSAFAALATAAVAGETPLAAGERLVFAALAGLLAYRMWLLGWAALLHRYPGLVAIVELVDSVEERRGRHRVRR